ncbi:DUF5615 family PIN-like protein [Belliella aquatica]|uniref:DUF5615 family PIN-like protein n=1 Tax=Belliella aquatica TaxID=1323734 RepID=UPI00166C1E51
MIFLLDANIPPSLAEDISGHEVIHVSTFPKGTSTSDREIIDFSHQNNCILISKDSDFCDSFLISKKPKINSCETRKYSIKRNKELFQEKLQPH